jgi:intergrase/recombinase
VQHNLREIDRKQKREYLEDTFRQATRTGTSDDITKAYKELAEFLMDDIKTGE